MAEVKMRWHPGLFPMQPVNEDQLLQEMEEVTANAKLCSPMRMIQRSYAIVIV